LVSKAKSTDNFSAAWDQGEDTRHGETPL